MEAARILESVHGPRIQIIQSEYEADEIDLEAIASWSELLGITDPVEVLEAINHVRHQHTEPEPDPETGENVWTDPWTLLQLREQEREREALRTPAVDDPRSLQLRTALAAHHAVHEPIDGGECAMDRCRRKARETLGVKDPAAKPGAMSRMSTLAIPGHTGEGDAETYASLLAKVAPAIDIARREFLHALAGGSENPLGDTHQTEPADDADPFAATLQKYGGTQ